MSGRIEGALSVNEEGSKGRNSPNLETFAGRPHSRRANVGEQYSLYLPLLGLAITVLMLIVFQTVQLSSERSAILTVKGNQDAAVAESQKVRDQFESISKGVAQLASKGNPNAVQIVNQLEKRGVKISLNAKSTQ